MHNGHCWHTFIIGAILRRPRQCSQSCRRTDWAKLMWSNMIWAIMYAALILVFWLISSKWASHRPACLLYSVSYRADNACWQSDPIEPQWMPGCREQFLLQMNQLAVVYRIEPASTLSMDHLLVASDQSDALNCAIVCRRMEWCRLQPYLVSSLISGLSWPVTHDVDTLHCKFHEV